MLSVAEAQERVLAQVRPLPATTERLAVSALGLVLAEDVTSDLDMPPFAKAMMDGFAVRSGDLAHGSGQLTVVEEITAGKMPSRAIEAGQAAQIMTGAPLPDGADAVVMIERAQRLDGGRVAIHDHTLVPGLNVMQRGEEMRQGKVVLRIGTRLRPQELGVLAAVGRTQFHVFPRPDVAVLATGDEVVDPGTRPGPSQIRNSNGTMLAAQVARAGAKPIILAIARDTLESLRPLIAEGLRAPILILAGGVSAGKLDLVPQALEEAGVQPLFHKVAMKPGKPVFFGVKPRSAANVAPHLVFGLPGNPVSAMVCFELFVRPAIRALMARPPGPHILQGTLTGDFTHRSDRPTYRPATLCATAEGWSVQPVPWIGSPDLRGVTAANAFAILPEGEHAFRAGQRLPVLCVDDDQ